MIGFIYCIINESNQGASYIDSPEWIKNKKATINAINKKYNKCFQYAVKIELNHEKIRKNSDRMTKIRPVTNKYNKEKINFTSKKGHWKKLRKII